MKEVEKKKLFAYSAANGCLTNLLETTSFRNSLDTNHYDQTSSAQDADVIFINTCGYNSQAETHSLDVIGDFQKKFPDKKIIVSGCLPRINKEAIQKKFDGPIIPTGEIHKMNDLMNESIVKKSGLAEEAYYLDETDLQTRLSSNKALELARPLLKKVENLAGTELGPLSQIIESSTFDHTTFAISVARGCLGKCNYCAIKKAKGRLVSRPLPEIIARVQKALEEGAKKIHLLGDDIGCWGQDLNLNSSHLLSALLRLNFEFKIIINYFDPTWMNRYFADLAAPLSNPKIICVNIPIQSGNNDILKKMDRDYDIHKVIENIKVLKMKNPQFLAKTHIMVGYPGETHRQFLDSLSLVKEFDLIYPNKYGPRPGTPAEKMQQLPDWVRTYRFYHLSAVIALQHAKVFLRSLFKPTKPLEISYES